MRMLLNTCAVFVLLTTLASAQTADVNAKPLSDSDIRDPHLPVVVEVRFVFVKVRAHHHHALECDVFSDLAANADDGIHNPRSSQNRAFGNNRFSDLAIVDS